MNIRISVVEDNKPFRASLVQLIQATPGLELVGEFSNAEQAETMLDRKTDIVIIDIVLPQMTGIELIRKVKARDVSVQFLICSSYDDDEKIFAALEAGACGYILKDYSSAQIIDAINEIYNGGSPMSPYIARRVINSFQKKNHHDGLLTDREKEILELASTGKMYKEIGEALDITHETVKRHMKNIYQKLHVQNKIEAINKFKAK